jgi:hypothetical protein
MSKNPSSRYVVLLKMLAPHSISTTPGVGEYKAFTDQNIIGLD